jgi:transposase
MRQQAAAGDIILLFADESEVRTHPYLAHAWAKRGADLRVEAPGQSRKRCLLGARDSATAELLVITSDTKRSADFIDLLEAIDRRYDLGPSYEGPPVVLVLDNASIHRAGSATAALAKRSWIRVEWLPTYTPELNDIERDWRTLKRLYLANQSIFEIDALDQLIHLSICRMNDRASSSCTEFSSAA